MRGRERESLWRSEEPLDTNKSQYLTLNLSPLHEQDALSTTGPSP